MPPPLGGYAPAGSSGPSGLRPRLRRSRPASPGGFASHRDRRPALCAGAAHDRDSHPQAHRISQEQPIRSRRCSWPRARPRISARTCQQPTQEAAGQQNRALGRGRPLCSLSNAPTGLLVGRFYRRDPIQWATRHTQAARDRRRVGRFELPDEVCQCDRRTAGHNRCDHDPRQQLSDRPSG